MPHVIVKLWPGKSEKQKTRLTEAIVKDVMTLRTRGSWVQVLPGAPVKQRLDRFGLALFSWR
jgi:hypothetical protein